MKQINSKLSFWSAIMITFWVIMFDLTIIVGIFGISTQIASMISSFFIAIFFIILIIAIHNNASPNKKIWSQGGLSFAVIYSTVVSVNYFLQLTVVRYNPQLYPWLTMDFQKGSVFWALETLGYSLMALSMLFIIPIFGNGKTEKLIKWIFIVNGILSFIASIAYVITVNPLHPLILLSLGFWAIAFPIATALLASTFNISRRKL